MGRLPIYFSVDKRHWPDLVLLQCVLWKRGTGLSWDYYNVFVLALAVSFFMLWNKRFSGMLLF